MPKDRFHAYAALLVAVVLWAVAGPVIKVTLRDIPPFTFLALRFFLNTIIISPILWLYLKRAKSRTSASPNPSGLESGPTRRVSPAEVLQLRDLPRLFLLTILGTTATLALIFLGLDRTTALDATLLIATAPLFIVIGGSLVCIRGVVCLHEKVTRMEKIGLAVAMTGVGVTIIQPLLGNGIFARANLTGNLLVLASNLTWAAFTLLVKEDFKRYSPFLITATSFIFGFLTFIPLALLENPDPLFAVSRLPLAAWQGVLYMSIFSSIVAYFAYAWGVSKIEASEAALFMYLEPIFAAPFAYWWLGEKITTPFLIGAGVIAAGVFLTEYRPKTSSA